MTSTRKPDDCALMRTDNFSKNLNNKKIPLKIANEKCKLIKSMFEKMLTIRKKEQQHALFEIKYEEEKSIYLPQ